MYTLTDKTGATRNIQEKLQLISEGEKIVTNGIFDEKTRIAIHKFQKSKMLPQTGVVDKETFYALVDSYRAAKVKGETPKDIPFPIKRSNIGHYMTTVNSAIKTVYEYYFGVSALTSSQIFSTNTENAVKELKTAFLLEENGEIDAYFYKRLMNEVDSIKKLSFFKI